MIAPLGAGFSDRVTRTESAFGSKPRNDAQLAAFTRAVIWLLGLNTAIFLLMELFGLVRLPALTIYIRPFQPHTERRDSRLDSGKLLLTASFIPVFGIGSANMLGLWMFGSALEGAWGSRRFLELFSFGVIGAAITTIVVSYGHVLGGPNSPTVGASGGVFAILIAFGIVFAENEIMLIPFPFLIKAKYFIAILIVVELAFAMKRRRRRGVMSPIWADCFSAMYM